MSHRYIKVTKDGNFLKDSWELKWYAVATKCTGFFMEKILRFEI